MSRSRSINNDESRHSPYVSFLPPSPSSISTMLCPWIMSAFRFSGSFRRSCCFSTPTVIRLLLSRSFTPSRYPRNLVRLWVSYLAHTDPPPSVNHLHPACYVTLARMFLRTSWTHAPLLSLSSASNCLSLLSRLSSSLHVRIYDFVHVVILTEHTTDLLLVPVFANIRLIYQRSLRIACGTALRRSPQGACVQAGPITESEPYHES